MAKCHQISIVSNEVFHQTIEYLSHKHPYDVRTLMSLVCASAEIHLNWIGRVHQMKTKNIKIKQVFISLCVRICLHVFVIGRECVCDSHSFVRSLGHTHIACIRINLKGRKQYEKKIMNTEKKLTHSVYELVYSVFLVSFDIMTAVAAVAAAIQQQQQHPFIETFKTAKKSLFIHIFCLIHTAHFPSHSILRSIIRKSLQ